MQVTDTPNGDQPSPNGASDVNGEQGDFQQPQNELDSKPNGQEDNATDPQTTNQRLLEESKKWKAKAREAQRKLDELETQKKEEQGKWKEAYEETKAQLTKFQEQVMKSNIRTEVTKKGAQYGLVDADDLMKVADASHLQYDPETGEVEGVEEYLESARKAKPYLFRKEPAANINPANPNGLAKKKSLSAQDASKLSSKDFRKLLAGVQTRK